MWSSHRDIGFSYVCNVRIVFNYERIKEKTTTLSSCATEIIVSVCVRHVGSSLLDEQQNRREETETDRNRVKDAEGMRQRERDRDRQRHRERGTEKDEEGKRQKEIDRQRQRERYRGKETETD